MREAPEGTAARPGKKLSLMSMQDANAYLAGTVSNLDQDLKVCQAYLAVLRDCAVMSCDASFSIFMPLPCMQEAMPGP